MILLPIVSISLPTVITFLVNNLLQIFNEYPHIKTIFIYQENQISPEFINTILDHLSSFDKALLVFNLNTNDTNFQSKTNKYEAVHVFLWKNDDFINTSFTFTNTPFIQSMDKVFFVFEEPQNPTVMNNLHLSLSTMSNAMKMVDTYLVFENIFTKQSSMIVVPAFNTPYLPKRHQVNLQGTNISVLLVLRPPNVVKHEKNFGGRDGKMASFLSKYFNANFDYVTQVSLAVLVVQNETSSYVPLNHVQDNDSFVVDDESKPMVLNVSSELLLNSRMCCDITNKYINFYPHEFDSYVVLVPSASSTPYQRRLFHPTTGLFSFIVFVSFSLIWIFFKYFLRTNDESTDYGGIFIEVLGILLLTKAAKDSFFISERLLITFILFFATVMSIIEAGIIYDEMVKDVDPIEINSLRELGNTNLSILLTADAKVLMEFGKVGENVQKKFVLTDTNEITYDILSRNTSKAYVLRQSRAESLLNRYTMQKNGKSIFHIIKEPLLPSLLSYYARENFPYTDDFNHIVQKTIENGIFQHFDRISKYNIYFKDNHLKEIDDAMENQEKVITMTEVMSTLLIFLIGMTMSCIILILEIVFVKIQPIIQNWKQVKTRVTLMRKENENLFEFARRK